METKGKESFFSSKQHLRIGAVLATLPKSSVSE